MMKRPSLSGIRREVKALTNPKVALSLQRYFKTGGGQYGEGDRFLGIRVPALRRLARAHASLNLDSVCVLLRSSWHEERMLALFILVEQYRLGDIEVRETVHQIYMAHKSFINNWDLVDASAEHLVGAHIDPRDLTLLRKLARAPSLWDRRIAIVATYHWIKKGEFSPALSIADVLLVDPYDLVQKAVGWMVREVGKRDPEEAEAFLAIRYKRMPRTMLRAAVEGFSDHQRKRYLAGLV